jgi:hypothetical protein
MDLGLDHFQVLTVHQTLVGQIMVQLVSLVRVTVISMDKEGLQHLTIYQVQVALVEDRVHTMWVALLDPQMHIYLQIPVPMMGNFLEVVVWVIQDLKEKVSVVHLIVLPIVMTILALAVQVMMLLALEDHGPVHLIPTHPVDQEEVMV